MTFTLDPIYLNNFMLCIVIVVLGGVGYARSKNEALLFIGIAFALFAVSHMLTLWGLQATLTTFLIVIRVIAYVLVAVAVYRLAFKR
jgi:hypothetical protein